MEPQTIFTTARLSERSAKSVWKGMLITALVSTLAVLGFGILMAQREWIVRFDKSIELHLLPFFCSAFLLGIVWAIRGLVGFLRSSNIAPMERDEYWRLRDIYEESNDFPSDRLTRWTIAVLLVAGGCAFQVAPGAVDSLKVSLLTFWLPLVACLSAAVYAFDVTLILLILAVVAVLLWGLSLLPIPLAIVVGAGIIAYAIYKRGR